MTQITLTVDGWPPKKSEAKSLLSKEHGDRDCVVNLLRAVMQATNGSQWDRTEKRPVGLELVVKADTPDRIPGDATNYLGGVSDVLQANKPGNVDMAHLGNLVLESLYQNDRQIQEVRYSVEKGDDPGYLVRVWIL